MKEEIIQNSLQLPNLRKLFFVFALVLFGIVFFSGDVFGQGLPPGWTSPYWSAPTTTNQTTDEGVTFTFSQPALTGKFITGDYWVVGPVTITGMSPAYNGVNNGWMVNPSQDSLQGYDRRLNVGVWLEPPSLPYAAQPGSSIVKAISSATCTGSIYSSPCVDRQIVLTVLSAPPPLNGQESFRPPFFGTVKPIISATNLRTNLLPSLPTTGITDIPAWGLLADRWSRPYVRHGSDGGFLSGNVLGRHNGYDATDPVNCYPVFNSNCAPGGYGRQTGKTVGTTLIKLMLNYPLTEKMPTIIGLTQAGIDMARVAPVAGFYVAGAHNLGPGPMVLFAALMTNDAYINSVAGGDVGNFQEKDQLRYDVTGTVPLWAVYSPFDGEYRYWSNYRNSCSNFEGADIYRYIDGGHDPGHGYQEAGASATTKPFALFLLASPTASVLWNYPATAQYADRWENVGTWTQPDPCAPPPGYAPGLCTDPAPGYGVTYGPNGQGGCILDTNPSDGIGRFPEYQGYSQGTADSSTPFTQSAWTAIRPLVGGATGTISGTVSSSAGPIVGATVTTSPAGGLATTTSTGAYTMTVATGTYSLTASAVGYVSATQTNVVVNQGATTTRNFVLTAVPPPNAPTNAAATANSPTQITLTWTDTNTNEDGYVVERSSTSSTTGFTQITPAPLAANTINYIDSGLTAVTQYWYRVRAIRAGLYSPYSNTATATTQNYPTCSAQGGNICSTGTPYCSGSSVPHSGTGVCCIGTCTATPQNLITHYRLNEAQGVTTFLDERGINTASCNSATCPTAVAGVGGNGRDYLISNQFIQAGILQLNANAGTVAFWAKPRIFTSAPGYFIGHTTGTTSYADRIQIYTEDVNGVLRLGLGDSHTTNTNVFDLTENTWYHIALTWNNPNYVVYVNGVQRASGTYLGLNILNNFVDIGNDGASGFRASALNGVMDEVRFYNSAITASDVLALYNEFANVLVSCSSLGGAICSGSTPYCTGTLQSSLEGQCCTGGSCTSTPSGPLYYYTLNEPSPPWVNSG